MGSTQSVLCLLCIFSYVWKPLLLEYYAWICHKKQLWQIWICYVSSAVCMFFFTPMSLWHSACKSVSTIPASCQFIRLQGIFILSIVAVFLSSVFSFNSVRSRSKWACPSLKSCHFGTFSKKSQTINHTQYKLQTNSFKQIKVWTLITICYLKEEVGHILVDMWSKRYSKRVEIQFLHP